MNGNSQVWVCWSKKMSAVLSVESVAVAVWVRVGVVVVECSVECVVFGAVKCCFDVKAP